MLFSTSTNQKDDSCSRDNNKCFCTYQYAFAFIEY
jgi:hypothetical protein